MLAQRVSRGIGELAVGALAICMGALIVLRPEVGLGLVALVVACTLIASPAATWVATALVAALTFKGLVSLGLLPGVATFFDIPLAWGAFFVALIKRRELSPLARTMLRWVTAFSAVALLSWLFHPTEPVRPILYVLLVGEPFALVTALLMDPPTLRMRRVLTRLLVALTLIQIPVAAYQFAALGAGDYVQGTLVGAGAGAHVISAIAVLAAIWIYLDARFSFGLRVLVATSLLAIPFLADAKQVIVALPAIVLGVGSLSWRRRFLIVGLSVALLAGLLLFVPAGGTAGNFIERAATGESGKLIAASIVWDEISKEPSTLAFGLGPAKTVSRAAFMTTERFLRAESPLRVFQMEPARLAEQVNARAISVSGGGTSFNSGVSSALGVLGDVGLVGLAVYLGMLLTLAGALRSQRTPGGYAALAGFVLFAVLGVVFDWWEQPPFTLFVAALAGLALTSGGDVRSSDGKRRFVKRLRGTVPNGGHHAADKKMRDARFAVVGVKLACLEIEL